MGKRTGNPKGRPSGALNKTTASVRELARHYGEAAIAELVRIMKKGESDTVKFAAARELLDRGFGKPTITIAGDEDNPIHHVTPH